MTWAERDPQKWNDGWRPSLTEIDKYRNDRLSLALHAKRKRYDIRQN